MCKVLLKMKIGERIKKLRELRNFSQQYMAEKLELKQQTYSRMETGDIDFPVSRLTILAEILGMRISDIFSFDEKTIFNSYHYNTQSITNGGNNVLRDNELLTELKKQYEARIEDLQQENARLHKLLENALKK